MTYICMRHFCYLYQVRSCAVGESRWSKKHSTDPDGKRYMSLVMTKPVFGFPTWTVLPQKMVRGLKLSDSESRGIVLCSKNKGADQLHSYCGADLHLCFRIWKKHVFS